MKTLSGTIIALIAFLALSATCRAADQVSAVLAPLSTERITILAGEKAVMALGQKDGVIKGDVGSIATDKSEVAKGAVIGQCAVIKSSLASSVCEMITVKKEAEPGDKIFFDRVAYSDPNIYPAAIAMLSGAVEPYEPYKQIKMMVYGVFDEQNGVTSFSNLLKNEITNIFSQKKRIHMASSKEFNDFVFYPGAGYEALGFARAKMKKSNIDVLLIGSYRLEGQNVTITMTEVRADGGDTTSTFSLPQAKYAAALARVVLPAQEETPVQSYPCSFFVKGKTAKVDNASDKAVLIRKEADGNAFVELGLKRSDFNIVSPVDIKIKIDGAFVSQNPVERVTVPIYPGSHRLVVSFRRGYYFDESLVYTSQKEIAKEVGLDLHKIKNLSISVDLSPLFEKETIGLRVIEQAGRQKETIEPIPRVEWDRTLEVFKD